jgi:uncharacterized protein
MVAGHLGLILPVIKLGTLGWLQRGLAAAGQMALTNYIAQTLICTCCSTDSAWDSTTSLNAMSYYLLVAAIAAVEMIWSVIWLRNFRFGPLEWIWRSLTYWTRQPMRLGGTGPLPGHLLGAT